MYFRKKVVVENQELELKSHYEWPSDSSVINCIIKVTSKHSLLDKALWDKESKATYRRVKQNTGEGIMQANHYLIENLIQHRKI